MSCGRRRRRDTVRNQSIRNSKSVSDAGTAQAAVALPSPWWDGDAPRRRHENGGRQNLDVANRRLGLHENVILAASSGDGGLRRRRVGAPAPRKRAELVRMRRVHANDTRTRTKSAAYSGSKAQGRLLLSITAARPGHSCAPALRRRTLPLVEINARCNGRACTVNRLREGDLRGGSADGGKPGHAARARTPARSTISRGNLTSLRFIGIISRGASSSAQGGR